MTGRRSPNITQCSHHISRRAGRHRVHGCSGLRSGPAGPFATCGRIDTARAGPRGPAEQAPGRQKGRYHHDSGPADVRQGCPGGLGRRAPRRRRRRSGRRSRRPGRPHEPRAAAARPPSPRRPIGIEHVIVVMMENRSFDHFLGWLPGADGRQAGLVYTDTQRHAAPDVPPDPVPGLRLHRPRPLLRGRPHAVQRREDGRLPVDGSGQRPVRHRLLHGQRPPLPSRLATNYTVLDHYFCSLMAQTYPNRFFQHAGATDRLDNTVTRSDPAHHLGPAQPATAGRPVATTPPTSRSSRCGARSTRRFRPLRRVPRRRRHRRSCPTSPSSTPTSSARPTAASNDDHPLADIRAGAPSCRRSSRRGLGTGLGQDRARHQLRRVGRLLRPRRCHAASPTACRWAPAPATGVGDAGPQQPGPGAPGFRVPCIVASPFAASAQTGRRSPLLRPHVGPQDDRVALGARAAHRSRRLPTRRPTPATSPPP